MISAVVSAPINFRGRFVYLEMLQAHWPELLNSLVAECLSTLAEIRRTTPLTRPATTIQELEASAARCAALIRAWAPANGFRDEWLVDAAVQTLEAAVATEKAAGWKYIPADLP